MKRTIHLIVPVLALLMLTPGLFAQENAQTDGEAQPNASEEPAQPAETAGGGGGLGFGMGLTFGVSSFENPDTGEVETYQLLALRPEFVLGNFGLGLDLPVNYRFTGGDNGDEFEVREADWVPDSDTSFLELYLPKFRYIRYGQKGDDVYARFGGIPGATIGNGFLVNGYSNELYLPDRRIFGAVFDLDSALAGVKYFGFETMVSNVAAFDVMAGRFYVRPLAGTGLPLLPNLQVGVTVAADRNPYYFAERDPDSVYYDTSTPNDTALMWGLDVRQPILSGDVLSLAAFGDVAFQEDRVGTMVGAGGRAAGFLLYGAQIRVTQDNFIPGYFDNTYDRRRLERLAIFNGDTSVAGGASWLAQLGFSALGDGIVFNTSLTGPFTTSPDVYPELRSTLTVAEGIVPGFSGLSAEASYTKFDIREYNDLVSAENAMIGAQINIRSGPVVISLLYDLTYDPQASGGDQWTVTSGLESTISF